MRRDERKENLQDWEYWADWDSSWTEDWTMEVECEGSPTDAPTPPPDAEPCTWGPPCDDCDIWNETDGVRWPHFPSDEHLSINFSRSCQSSKIYRKIF